ncbi:class I SAM-dependent methyltransferase [Thermaerobacter sp. FW80]|nr:class I SAM-dependent methyltransferase [Thermaerobacter sp. FW80]
MSWHGEWLSVERLSRPKGPFDVVVMNLMLMDVDDLQRVFASAAVCV